MYKRFMKRGIDIFLSLFLLPVIIPCCLIIAVSIFFEDREACFYIANRLGKNGKNFKMFKFRTMKKNAPDIRNEDGSTFNSEDDPRLTRLGKFLRKTSLDELPQILNVIKGDMSFVGPRPDLPEHINSYSLRERKKLEVLPGITGYNQAFFRNSVEWRERLENDVYYVENISLILDIKIVFYTIYSVFTRKNIFVNKEDV